MGEKLVRRKGLICAWILIAAVACAPQNATSRPGVPKIPATVVTIQTTLQPQNKTWQNSIIIAGGRARSDDEADRWRLFDLHNARVTFVDDVGRTYAIQPVDRLIAERRLAADGPLPAGVPRAEVIRTGAKRTIAGVEATQLLIRMGGYQRELWIGDPPSVPPNFFATWFATRPVNEKYEPMMRDVDEALMTVNGFPLADHSELDFGKQKMIVDRTVVSVQQRDVDESLLIVKGGYRNLTTPAASPPPASSPLHGQSTRAAEWQFSVTGRKNP